ncbi:Protein-S-isoprenylcysteine O-methyltransferase [Acipenser ruthenus]|uniref:Protein-S-isoprenylcysteine O-methyltransferase n=1 Tax=Acipenser ruthenus TaxID=7906 RepID=A0A444UQQ9_ACIRT|nr:Protein-S-isoprenylcysteine O-methyltransferase [Acipenser ruthenus]
MAGIKFVPEGRASVYSFVLGLGAVCIPLLSAAGSDIAWVQTLLPGIRTKLAIAVYVASVNGLLLVLYKGPVYQVAVRACFLGFAFGCGLLVSFSKTSWGPFGW